MVEDKSFYVSEIVRKDRISICMSCPDLLEKIKCKHCGCNMEIKTRLDWFGCPIGKWPAEKDINSL
jgi:hypothetical protein